MYATVLDTNVLRGLSAPQFAELTDAEARNDVRQYGDAWTAMELIAHLRSATDPAYGASRLALRRLCQRALLPASQAPRLISPSELQIARLVLGDWTTAHEQSLGALADLAREIGLAEASDDLGELSDQILAVAAHMHEKERWFADFFDKLRRQVYAAAASATGRERNRIIRSFTTSSEALRQDAEALISRAYRQAELSVPEPIPPERVVRVIALTRVGTHAVGVLLERILCDGADLSKSRIQNLIWDQEIAASLGQAIDGRPVMLVTNDSYFAEAAARTGNQDRVCTPSEYLAKLSRAG